MSLVRVASFSLSLDGFGAGPNQDLDNPLGVGENLFGGIDLPSLGYQCVEHVATPNATHIVIRKIK